MLELKNVCKSFEGRDILKGINLTVKKGDVFSLIGPNGSGKTTIVRLILGLYKPDSGMIVYNEHHDLIAFKQKTSFVLESFYLYKQLSARKNIELFYRLYHQKVNKTDMNQAIDEALKWVGLESMQHRKISFFSQGMKQRLCLARAIVVKPDFLILDEPLKGLDVDGKFEIRKLIKQLAQSGCTIFMNSHDLFEVEKLSNRVAFIQSGQVLEQGSIESLKERYNIDASQNLETLYKHLYGVTEDETTV